MTPYPMDAAPPAPDTYADLRHGLATPTAKLRLYADTLASAMPSLLAGEMPPPERLPPPLRAQLPEIPARLARLADEIDRLVDAAIGAVPAQTVGARPQGAGRPTAALTDQSYPPLRGPLPRVLLVEDDIDSRDFTQTMLEWERWEVAVAGDGGPALDLLAEERFDLILMDCRLPELDGWTATRQLRAEGPNRDTPVVGLSASPDFEDRERGLAAGMTDWLVKPLNEQGLVRLRRYRPNPIYRP